MKIISKFKDYYDFVAGYDTDPRKVYDRKMLLKATWEKELPKIMSMRSCVHCRPGIGFYKGEVWFCDIRYPYLLNVETGFYYYDYFTIPEQVRIYLENLIVINRSYDLADHFDIQLREDRKRGWSKIGWKWRSRLSEKEKAVNTKLKSPVVFTWLRDGIHEEFAINGVLEWVRFPQIKSAIAAFQEIYNWIPYIEPEMPSDPTDMGRFINKGFDKKTSFRGK